MRKKLTYDEVVKLLKESTCEDFIHNVKTLLTLVYEMCKSESLDTTDFIFSLFDDGTILVSDIKVAEYKHR